MNDSAGLCFVVLAHAHPAALADQVQGLRLLAPGARVVVFNGGRDESLTNDLDVERCPRSRPLRHGFLGPFHAAVLDWLGNDPPRHVVTLDSDALLVRSGLGALLDAAADEGCGYLGAHLAPFAGDTPWRPGRRFYPAWERTWQPVLGIPQPYRCFNPVQVFGAEYVRRLRLFPGREQLLQLIATTRRQAMEEIVWPSLAVAMDLAPRPLAGGRALQLGRHSPKALQQHLVDPEVFFVHKVGMAPDDYDRRLIREHIHGRTPDFTAAAVPPRALETAASPFRRAAATAKDVVARLQRRG